MPSLAQIFLKTPVAIRRLAIGELRTQQFSVTFNLLIRFEEGGAEASVVAVHRDPEGFWREEAAAANVMHAATETELVTALQSVRLESGIPVTLTTWGDLLRVAPDLIDT